MGEYRCKSCGAPLPEGSTLCPRCGVRRKTPVSRVWVLAFFVMGVLMGLLLLILQQGDIPGAWRALWPWQTAGTQTHQQQLQQPKAVEAHAGVAATHIEEMRCDRDKAQAVREKARTIATLSESGDTLSLLLGREWEYYSPGVRRSFVETLAEADRCLSGRGRELRFSYRGVLVARVGADGAVEMK